ncbi:MAG: hypothetical protein DRN04_17170 [Thermoprotei archaeon]|nr:MAG: hypothetical protein DRN04_17170 [Thermoprotei archaeon]
MLAKRKTIVSRIAKPISEYWEYVVMMIILVTISAILAGFVYATMNRVPPALFLRERGMVIVISMRSDIYSYFRQTGIETLGVAFLILLCSVGGLLMIEVPRRIKNYRLANLMFILGSVLFIASMLIIIGLYVYGKGWSIPF